MLRRTRLKVLLLGLLLMKMLLLIVMLLIVMLLLLLARIIRLRLARCEWLPPGRRVLVVARPVALFGAAHLVRLLLLIVRLTLAKLLLSHRDQTEIMLGMLIIIFRRNRIARALRVAGKLEIFFGDVRSCSSDLNIRPIGLVHSG